MSAIGIRLATMDAGEAASRPLPARHAGAVFRRARILAAALLLVFVGFATAAPAANLAALERRAEAGDVDAMVALADAWREGNGVAVDADRAIHWYEAADRAGDAYSAYHLGVLLTARRQNGDLDRAVDALSRALAAYGERLGPGAAEVADIAEALGRAHEARGEWAAALAQYERVLAIRRTVPGGDTAAAEVGVGNMLQQLGRYAEAASAYERALAAFRARFGDNHPAVATVLMNMGALRRKTQRFAEALDLYDRALAIRAATGAEPGLKADIHYNRCRVFMDLELAAEALAACDAAKALYAGLPPDHPSIALVDSLRAGALERLGRYDEAVDAISGAVAALEARLGAFHPSTLDALSNLPIVLDAAGRTDEAVATGQRALAAFEDYYGPGDAQVARLAANLGSFELHAGRADEAFGHAVEALAIGRPASAVLLAKEMINRIQATRGAAGGDIGGAVDRALADRFAWLTDRLAEDGAFAEAQYVSALVKAREFDVFTRGGMAPAEHLPPVRLTVGEQRLAVAYRKALEPVQALLDRIDRAVAADPVDVPAIEKMLAALPASRDKAAVALRTLFDRFDADRSAAREQRIALDAAYAEEERARLAALGPGVALYRAVATDRTLHLFVTTAGRATVHRTVAVERAALAATVFDTLAAIERRDPGADALLAALYEALVAPVAADLKAASAEVVMLDLAGFLRYVPYAALRAPHGYLVEDFALALATPAIPLRDAPPAGDRTDGAGFAVAAAHAPFPALPGAARELEAIFAGADGVGPLRGETRVDAAFDLPAFAKALAARPRYVHVASHFAFAPGNEDRSFLLLGTGAPLELARLRADAGLSFDGVDLLVLSACETARGGGAEGEEIESFGALAQANGAAAVAATLWRIADDSTARLMADFYDGLVVEGLDKAGALRRAQLAMIRGTPAAGGDARSAVPLSPADAATAHPFYWSAFVLMGDWR